LIPTVLQDDQKAFDVLPAYILTAIKSCDVFFAENIKTTRRYFKKWWKEMVIDDYQWFAIHKLEEQVLTDFKNALLAGKNIGIISEAGCPGVADPGQYLVEEAQKLEARVHPLVGPNSILLALMASGMNGQLFQFNGYLPIDKMERKKAIQHLEADAKKRGCTQIFIETPYRNMQLVEDIISSCHPDTRLCVAVDITSAQESIISRKTSWWKAHFKDLTLHKRPAIFLIQAG
jgi:16S rRNA (cytidine1402-2'-O)-methyltransferase